MVRLPVSCLDLDQIARSGQCFTWEPVGDGGWRIPHRDRLVTARQEGDSLLLSCSEAELEDTWRAYLDLDTDYAAILASIDPADPCLSRAAERGRGIRILRQDLWEVMVCFLISQNNNIPRIKGILERLCALLGAEIPGGGRAFPTAECLAACTAEMLAPVRAGFRAKYVIDAAQRVASGALDLEQVRAMPLDEARSALQTVRGVGPKVADCALLYGLHRTECFPLDVWMKRAMALLPGVSPADFGENAGVAQQYIFHYARMHPALFERETAVS